MNGIQYVNKIRKINKLLKEYDPLIREKYGEHTTIKLDLESIHLNIAGDKVWKQVETRLDVECIKKQLDVLLEEA